MSVYIKGMEMPTSCDDCEFCKRAISGYDWCCIPMVKGRSKPLDEPVIKPDWCPLIHVPPHGRLIDADELVERWTAPQEFYPNDYAVGVFDNGKLRVKDFRASVIDAPTVIEAEVQDA